MKLLENDELKIVKSKKYNYFFNKKTGFFARWGETKEDDPIMAPAPEIADIEITTKCNGVNGKLKEYNFSHNLQIWPSKKLCEKYKLEITRGKEGDIPLKLVQDLISGLVDISSNYCSIRRFSLDKNNLARLFLE